MTGCAEMTSNKIGKLRVRERSAEEVALSLPQSAGIEGMRIVPSFRCPRQFMRRVRHLPILIMALTIMESGDWKCAVWCARVRDQLTRIGGYRHKAFNIGQM
jgi:hypothetical protein